MDVKKYLEGFYKTTKNPSIKTMQYFMEEYNHPERNFKIIHIAGTNGKGSVTEMMTNILVKAGYKVGKFISPHLIHPNERISINHKDITDLELENYIKRLEIVMEKYTKETGIPVTLFELETTIALLYFKEQNCDFVVLETGLGGLYDSTNVVESTISIITSIGKDHMKILGKGVEEIARQKAGIIKENTYTIFPMQEESVNKIIEETCKNKNNTLFKIEQKNITKIEIEEDLQYFDYKNRRKIEVNLKGKKQITNACICIECIEILNKNGYNISEKALREGLNTVIHRARFETLSKDPLVIFDGAHNEPAMQNFIETVAQYSKKDVEETYIVSILKRKDYKEMLKILLKENAKYIFTDGNDKERFVEKEELEQLAKKILPKGNIKTMELVEAIKETKQKGEITFFVGSFYTYEIVRNAYKNEL